MTLVATQPLTDEPWQPLPPATLHVFTQGEEVGVP
ncbi:MAG: class II glutamine amidotransferase [Polyangia bacterium]